MADQLRLGSSAQPGEAPGFVTDQMLASFIADVEHVLRGAVCKLAAVRSHLEGASDTEPSPELMRLTLERLADPDAWLDDPRRQPNTLIGDRTPWELARETLGLAA